MPQLLSALVAFVREHHRHGELEGGLDDGTQTLIHYMPSFPE